MAKKRSVLARTYDGKRVTFYPRGTVMHRQKKIGEVPSYLSDELAKEVGYYTLEEMPCVLKTAKELARRRTTHVFPPHGRPARRQKIFWLRDNREVIAKRCTLRQLRAWVDER